MRTICRKLLKGNFNCQILSENCRKFVPANRRPHNWKLYSSRFQVESYSVLYMSYWIWRETFKIWFLNIGGFSNIPLHMDYALLSDKDNKTLLLILSISMDNMAGDYCHLCVGNCMLLLPGLSRNKYKT